MIAILLFVFILLILHIISSCIYGIIHATVVRPHTTSALLILLFQKKSLLSYTHSSPPLYLITCLQAAGCVCCMCSKYMYCIYQVIQCMISHPVYLFSQCLEASLALVKHVVCTVCLSDCVTM